MNTCLSFSSEVQDVINNCPVTLREQVEAQLSAFVRTLEGDSAEIAARATEEAQKLVLEAQVEDIQRKWDIHTKRLESLHKQYDRVVWSAVWKTLKDDAGQLFQEHRDRRVIAEDLHNECWRKISEQIDQFRDGNGASISGWLWKVSQNVTLDWKRRQARRSEIAPMLPLVAADNITAGTIGQPETERQRPNPWYRRGLRVDRLVRKSKRAALCQECGKVIPVVSGTFLLECGHVRPLGLTK